MRGKSPTLTMRVTNLEHRLDAMEASAALVADNTAEILDLMRGGKTVVRYAKRYGWRIGSAVVGYSLAAGWIDSAMADAAKTVFGI